MIKTQMFIAAALLAGVAIGYVAGGHSASDAPARTTTGAPKRTVPASISDQGEGASVKALRHRVAELERLLAEKETKSEIAISNAVAEAAKGAPPPNRPRANPREWLENLRKTDPARYAQTTNRFAQWRRSREERARSTMSFLSSVDTSHMSAKARETHDELQALIAKREELETRLHQENLSDADRDRLWQEMRQSYHELRRLNEEERTNLLKETAFGLGFEGEDAKEIVATIQDVIEATDSGWGGGRRQGGRRGPPPGDRPQGGPRGR